MPIYTYRREDGTTFDYRQKFTDDPLITDPETGLHVTRVIQPAGVIFKGSGFYVNDSKSASRSAIGTPPKSEKSEKSDSADKTEKSDKTEKASAAASKPAASSETTTKAPAAAAAD